MDDVGGSQIESKAGMQTGRPVNMFVYVAQRRFLLDARGSLIKVARKALAMALTKLILTDFDRLRDTPVDRTEMWGSLAPLSEDTAYERMVRNVALLRACFSADGHLPLNMVSGFPISEEDRRGLPELKSPADIAGGLQNVALLVWGSPHPNPSSSLGSIHGSASVSADYKTQAFEPMAWLSSGTSIMVFPCKYDVELYQPQHNKFDRKPQNRFLLCGRMYSREYVPMASGNGLRFAVPDVDNDHLMIAMLVPPRHLKHIAYRDGAVDFGATCLSILGEMDGAERAVSLGVYDASLEREIYLASQEKQ